MAKCPECGGSTRNKLHIKEGGPTIPAPCAKCLARAAERTHETIAKVCLDYGRKK